MGSWFFRSLVTSRSTMYLWWSRRDLNPRPNFLFHTSLNYRSLTIIPFKYYCLCFGTITDNVPQNLTVNQFNHICIPHEKQYYTYKNYFLTRTISHFIELLVLFLLYNTGMSTIYKIFVFTF